MICDSSLPSFEEESRKNANYKSAPLLSLLLPPTIGATSNSYRINGDISNTHTKRSLSLSCGHCLSSLNPSIPAESILLSAHCPELV